MAIRSVIQLFLDECKELKRLDVIERYYANEKTSTFVVNGRVFRVVAKARRHLSQRRIAYEEKLQEDIWDQENGGVI